MNLHDVHVLPWYVSQDETDPARWQKIYLHLTIKVYNTAVYGASPFLLSTATGIQMFVALKALNKVRFLSAHDALDWLKQEGLPEEDALKLLTASAGRTPPNEVI